MNSKVCCVLLWYDDIVLFVVRCVVFSLTCGRVKDAHIYQNEHGTRSSRLPTPSNYYGGPRVNETYGIHKTHQYIFNHFYEQHLVLTPLEPQSRFGDNILII